MAAAAVAAVLMLAAAAGGVQGRQTDAAASAPFNFTVFEDTLLPQWLARFRIGPQPGNFSYTPGGKTATVYGACDVVHLLAAVGQLDELDAATRSAWAAHINSFQNASGFFRVDLMESTAGFQPWHATGTATAALALLGHQPAHANTLYETIGSTPSLWAPTFDPLLVAAPSEGCDSIHSCAHKITAIPAVLGMTSTADPDPARFAPFFSWFFAWLRKNIDPATALWCKEQRWAPPNTQALGGSFAMHMAMHDSNQTWPLLATLVNTTATFQDAQGTWSHGMPVQYLDVDGAYQLLRSLAALDRLPEGREHCERFLAAAHASLTDPKYFVDPLGPYGSNTHHLNGGVLGVAECQRWFPDLVVTRRPWVTVMDLVPYV